MCASSAKLQLARHLQQMQFNFSIVRFACFAVSRQDLGPHTQTEEAQILSCVLCLLRLWALEDLCQHTQKQKQPNFSILSSCLLCL